MIVWLSKLVSLIFLFYLSGCNQTLYGSKGTFQSPNYPREYPDGQLCSWRITGIAGQRIRLRFTNFTLQKDNNTDSVRVFDGWNESSPSLGEFYGGHVPPGEGVTSSSDVMFVIFTSDAAFSYAGFQASFESFVLPGETEKTELLSAAVPGLLLFCTFHVIGLYDLVDLWVIKSYDPLRTLYIEIKWTDRESQIT